MKVAYVARSFLDYRVPVYRALDDLTGGGLHLIYSADYVPVRAQRKAQQELGVRAIGLRDEWKIGGEDAEFLANRNLSVRFQPRVLTELRRLRPDVIVCDGFFKWTFPSLVYRSVFKTPLVVLYERTFHTERKAQWFRTAYRRMALAFTDAMSCNGTLSKEYSVSLGMPPARITTGHMAADVERLAAGVKAVSSEQRRAMREAWRCGNDDVMFLYVGRLTERKGIAELLEGWSRFDNGDGVRSGRPVLVIVGDGPQRGSLERSAASRGLNVRFVGHVDYDSIAPFYAAADAFVIPTLEDNWSLVVPEAMACGLPVLCSTYNGCWPELVHEGVNGWVFDPLKPDDIQRALSEAAKDRATLHDMGSKSEAIVAEFSPHRAAEAILDACRIAMGRASVDPASVAGTIA
jgi:glycosyltransferase involved in cell wall biosynthesis